MIQKFSNVYQFSTITSLAAGNFDGMIKLGTLLKQGNFGLGTFDHLDGELIVLDGVGYQLKSDGTVNEVTANMTSPFAVMAFFEEHQKINISQLTSYEEIQQTIVDNLPSLNLFYGIKINGLFSEIKTRTVSWQEKPYPTLLKASEQQGILNAKNTNGDIVGFWTPFFANTLGVNGFHCHFINTEKNTGGHVFDFQLDSGTIEICYFSKINLELPTNKEYLETDLMAFELQKEIELAENAKKNKIILNLKVLN